MIPSCTGVTSATSTRKATGQKIYPADDQRYAILMNVQEGTDRYECHVDTNPVEALLYVTDHPQGTGGELVVTNDVDARSVAEWTATAPCSTRSPGSSSSSTHGGSRTTCAPWPNPACGSPWR